MERTYKIILTELIVLRLLWAPWNFLLGTICLLGQPCEYQPSLIRIGFGALGIAVWVTPWYLLPTDDTIGLGLVLATMCLAYLLFAVAMGLLLSQYEERPFSYAGCDTN